MCDRHKPTICPYCKGNVEIRDCNYSSFNPWTAYCRGTCGRKWSLGYLTVEDEAVRAWNRLAQYAKRIESTERKLKELRIQAGLRAE